MFGIKSGLDEAGGIPHAPSLEPDVGDRRGRHEEEREQRQR